ncbi:hypothetical protein [Streptomyces galbus]|uniref:Uncharacterized protein n=1 Tax=Streptomyces galbus TaxID=33898 RepID=A0ABX1IQQ9_STRGB|nr:hypothetical protein [Streptomyces galbus]NKQ27958.1 hypothetical protein [Streptomyces galbus]
MKLGKALATGVAEERPQTAATDIDTAIDISLATDTDLPAEAGDRSAADEVPAVR